jgi:3-deoxy-7-phosphoheptulonate synthase
MADPISTSPVSQDANWTPASWRAFPIKQQPEYKDPIALERALKKVESLPPIIHVNEVKQLKADLAAACNGTKFLLQVRPFSRFRKQRKRPLP